MIVYILFNVGIVLTIYGTVLYSPAIVPNSNSMSSENIRMELMNSTKGAFIAQNFEMARYNIGFDLLNIGGILLLISMLFYNYLATVTLSKHTKNKSEHTIKLHEGGFLNGNILEWLCIILFLFAFFTFFNSIFFYIILASLVIGIIGFATRKLHVTRLLKNINMQ
jgi:hypothetical protein